MGVENNIPEGWAESYLGEVSKVQTGPFGSQLKNEQYITGGTPVITVEHINDFRISEFNYPSVTNEDRDRLSKYLLKEGDIVFTRVGSVDLSAYVSKKQDGWMFSSRMLSVRPNKDVDSKYLSYFFRQPLFRNYIYRISVGATMPSINTGILKGIPISYPPLPEQKAIAKVLTAFDDKIELLQAQNKTLETMAQTIFKEWFGKYQIGDELPEGWRVAKINEFVKASIGGDYGKETIEGDYTEETICLRGTDLPDMKMGIPEKAPIRFLKASKLERCKLENGDIVVEISGGTENQSTGRTMYINEKILNSAKHPMTCVNFCRIIRPSKLEYSYFLNSLFDYLYIRKVFFNWENGTTGIKNLNLKALLEDFDLIIPKNEESILDFNKNVKAVFNKIQSNNSQIQSLAKTRDTLLPKLMSGQVQVNNLKQTVDA